MCIRDRDKTVLHELIEHHVSGQLKVAPEHCSAAVLDAMGKPHIESYLAFQREFFRYTKKIGKEQYLSLIHICHSIGVPLAVAAKHSFIAPSATMTIHPVRMSGLMLGVPQTMDYFQRMQERITRFVTANSHISASRFYELAMNTQELVMDVGTVLDGVDAVEEGLIDSLGSLSDALACLYRMIDGNGKKQNRKKKDSRKEES